MKALQEECGQVLEKPSREASLEKAARSTALVSQALTSSKGGARSGHLRPASGIATLAVRSDSKSNGNEREMASVRSRKDDYDIGRRSGEMAGINAGWVFAQGCCSRARLGMQQSPAN